MTKKFGAGVREDLVDDPAIRERLRAFGVRVDRMESQMEQLTRNFPDHWVALYSEDFVLAGSLDDLLKTLEGQGVPTSETVIRFLDSNPKNIIL